MKFIHFADAHLDSPFRGLSFLPSNAFNQIASSTDQSLSKIVDIALNEQVDLVLIAGDTFDSNHPSPRSQLFFAKEIKRLTDAEIQVVMIFGNHDHMSEKDLLVNQSPYFKLLGPNEKVESASFTTKSGFKYDVVGFSYLNNHILTDKIIEFPQKSSNFTIGIMHAQEKTDQAAHDVYAPFEVKDIKELNYNYFALGHIHLRQNISENPRIVYPGNIQGRHINELGEKGCYLGIIDENSNQVKLEFKKTGPIVWKSQELILDHELSKSDLSDLILQNLKATQTTYFSLQINGAQLLTEEELELVQDTDFWQNISMKLENNSQLVDVRLKNSSKLSLNSSDQAAFDQAFNEVFSVNEFGKFSKDWQKKDQLAEKFANDSDFLKEVENLAKVKMGNELKGIIDET